MITEQSVYWNDAPLELRAWALRAGYKLTQVLVIRPGSDPAQPNPENTLTRAQRAVRRATPAGSASALARK